MISVPDNLPDDPAALKLLLAQLLAERTVDKGQIVDLKEQVKLLRDRLFNRKSEQTVESNTPQLALFNEPESQWVPTADDADEEVVAPASSAANASHCRLTCHALKSFMTCPSTN